MAETPMVMMTVEIPGARPGVNQAAKALGVRPDAIDRSFGVISVDPRKHLYAVQVRASDIPGAAAEQPYQGPFSNPKIAPFGLTED